MQVSGSDLESIAQSFWSSWRIWRLSDGWTLGPDNPSLKMSPDLVSDWVHLPDNRRDWFRQHAALVLYATPPMADPRVLAKVCQCEKALRNGDLGKALRKARTARKILSGEALIPPKDLEADA